MKSVECGARNERAPHEAAKQMNQLLPIVRRVRRPLIQADAETRSAEQENIQPAATEAQAGRQSTFNTELLAEGPAEAGTTNEEHAKPANKRKAR